MRSLMSVAIVAIGASLMSLPAARAQDQNDPSTPPSKHVRQHQDAVPSPQDRSSQEGATRRDQSAQAPKSPAVITPPATGDKSVITPPDTGAAKTPVIPPPGTPGNNNNDVEPK
jgi:hypothetical protein